MGLLITSFRIPDTYLLHLQFVAGLENEKDLDTHFPLEEITSDYLNASSSIRDARSRIVTLKFKLSSLKLDYKAQDKFLRLVGTERYSPDTDIVTITSDRCPYRYGTNFYFLTL